MAHGTRVVAAVFAAVGAVLAWLALVYGAVVFAGLAFDLSAMAEETRTALTIGVLGATLAGAVVAAMVCFFVVAGESDATDSGSSGTRA